MKSALKHAGITGFSGTNKEKITFTHGKGYEIYDTNNKSYIDFILGYGPVILGHSTDSFLKQLQEYLQHGLLMPGYTKWHDLFIERFVKKLDKNLVASFFKTASEAVTAAIRLSTMATKKQGIIRCGFIGWHDAQIGMTINWHEQPDSPFRNVLKNTAYFRGIQESEPVFNWTNFNLEQFSDIIQKHGAQIGAFVLDAYQTAFMKPATLQEALKLCRNNNIKIIFDETKTGGRVSKYGIAYQNKLDYDLLILGKALANGAPISIIIGKKDLLAMSEAAQIQGTFSKEMFAIYCALITQKIMDDSNGYDILQKTGEKVVFSLNKAAKKAQIDHLIQAKQLFQAGMFDIYFSDPLLKNIQERSNLTKFLTDEGVLLFEGHPSFVCLEHANMDWDNFEQSLEAGMKNWFKNFNNNL